MMQLERTADNFQKDFVEKILNDKFRAVFGNANLKPKTY